MLFIYMHVYLYIGIKITSGLPLYFAALDSFFGGPKNMSTFPSSYCVSRVGRGKFPTASGGEVLATPIGRSRDEFEVGGPTNTLVCEDREVPKPPKKNSENLYRQRLDRLVDGFFGCILTKNYYIYIYHIYIYLL